MRIAVRGRNRPLPLLRHARDPQARLSERTAAAAVLLDRSIGKPLQSIELSALVGVDQPAQYALENLSTAEQAQLLEILERVESGALSPAPSDGGDGGDDDE